jgi:hypothetical protein
VLKNLSGSKQEEWRKLRNEGLRGLFFSADVRKSDQVKDDEMVAACGMYRTEGKGMQGFGGETGRKEPT